MSEFPLTFFLADFIRVAALRSGSGVPFEGFFRALTSLEAHSETRPDKTSHRIENVFANKTEQHQRMEAGTALLHRFSFHSPVVAHVPTSLFHSLSIYPSVSSLSFSIHSSHQETKGRIH